MNGLYTASEAREQLGGIAGASLQRLVDDGKIRKIVPPENKKRGLYNKEDVDKLAGAMQQFMDIYTITQSDSKPELIQAQNEEEIKATVRIDQQYFGDQIHSLEKRLYWFKICPNGDYVLKHHGIIVGYFSMQGIKQEAVERLFLHRKGNPKTQAEDMIPLAPGEPLQAYVSMIAVKADEKQAQQKTYGLLLLLGLEKVFIDLGKQGIDIRTIWAKSGTVPGIKLSRDFGFSEMGYINNEQMGFCLDIETSPIPMVQKYREALKEAKAHQDATPNDNKQAEPKNKTKKSIRKVTHTAV